MKTPLPGRILDAARRQFLEKGYAAVSIRELIEPLGISKGGFYHHFPSKKTLFLAVVDRLLSDWAESVTTITSDGSFPVKERMRRLFLSPLARAGVQYGLLYEGLRVLCDVRTQTIRIVKEMLGQCEALLLDGQRSGEIRESLDCESWGFQIASTIEGGYLLATLGDMANLEDRLMRSFESTWRRVKAVAL